VLPQRCQAAVAQPAQALSVQGHDLTHACTQDFEQIVAGVAAILHQRIFAAKAALAEGQLPEEPAENGTPFRAKAAAKVSIDAYLARILEHLPCSSSCFVLALAYLDRVARSDTSVAVCERSCHRLILVSIMLAKRFYDEDEDTHFHNAWFAKLGGINVANLAKLELEFLRLIDWRLHVSPEEYGIYHERVCSAALTLEEDETDEEHCF